MASSDLGGLGAGNGLPFEYNWVLPNITPLFLPWLALVALLALKANRHAAAWLIWLPIGCITALTLVPPPFLAYSRANFLLDAFAALALGVTAVWLLSDYLRQSSRLLTFLCILFAAAGFSGLAFLSREGWNLLNPEAVPVGIVLAVSVVITALAISAGGLVCRGRYRPIGLYPWLFVLLAGIWLLSATSARLIVETPTRGSISSDLWIEFLMTVLLVAILNFAVLLPFLILSSASPFYRERLKALLHVKPETPPVLSAPLQEADLRA